MDRRDRCKECKDFEKITNQFSGEGVLRCRECGRRKPTVEKAKVVKCS